MIPTPPIYLIDKNKQKAYESQHNKTFGPYSGKMHQKNKHN